MYSSTSLPEERWSCQHRQTSLQGNIPWIVLWFWWSKEDSHWPTSQHPRYSFEAAVLTPLPCPATTKNMSKCLELCASLDAVLCVSLKALCCQVCSFLYLTHLHPEHINILAVSRDATNESENGCYNTLPPDYHWSILPLSACVYFLTGHCVKMLWRRISRHHE